MGEKKGSGINNPNHIAESLETIFWVKILEFFDADPGWKKFESGTRDPVPFLPLDPGSWMGKKSGWIRDPDPG
jgi:hypothetical protein